jgi:hypothetical protein
MGDYAGLTLDPSKIENAVRSFPGNNNADPAVDGTGFKTYTVELDGQIPGLFQVYRRNDDKFTLKFKLGKNQALSEQVAKHVFEICSCDAVTTRPLSLKALSEQDWEFLQESLTEDGFKLQEEQIQHGRRFKVSGSGTDHVYIHRYNTGKFLLQGRTRGTYSAVVNALSYTHTDRKELIESQLATVPVTIVECSSLMTELEQRIPSASAKMNETLKTILAPALLVHKLSADLPDYSLMVYPALRGMEGCIKDIFSRCGYVLGAKLNIGDQFDGKTKQVTAAVRANLGGCSGSCDAAALIYGHFSAHRNGLLHVDSLVATTRIIDRQSEAAEIIDNAFHLIEKAYELIP